MDRFTSAEIALPSSDIPYYRADLVFYAVDHAGPSFQARIFFNNSDADENTECSEEHGYAGAFHIFGHGGCFGEEGHCDVPTGPRDPFDLRPPHQLTRITKTVIVTAAVKRHSGETIRVTVVPVVRSEGAVRREDVLEFDSMRLLTFE
jgi:tyrosinase